MITKLGTVIENVPKVYASGYDTGHIHGYELGKAEGESIYDTAFAEGKQAEYNIFWDNFQSNGSRTNYLNGFSGDGWNATTFKPKYSMNVSYGYQMFRNARVNVDLVELCNSLGIEMTFGRNTDFTQTFQNCRFTRVGVIDTTSASTLSSTFATSYIKTIDKLVLKAAGGQTFSSTFNGASGLEEITEIEGVFSNAVSFNVSPLNAKSLVNVVEHLSESASGKSVTFLTSAVNNADWSTTNDASWEDLVAQKKPSGWTISLV